MDEVPENLTPKEQEDQSADTSIGGGGGWILNGMAQVFKVGKLVYKIEEGNNK